MRVFKKTLCLDSGEVSIPKPKPKPKTKLVDNLLAASESPDINYEDSSKHCRLLLNASNTVVVASGMNKTRTISTTDTSSCSVSSISGSGSSSTTGDTKGNEKTRKGYKLLLVMGSINLLLGILSLIWTPFNIFMNERLRMVPGFPPFEWWKTPPDEVLMKVYILNITNSDEFMSGLDKKLRYEEIGPFVFLEKLIHTDVVFNDNGTMTYVARRSAIFLPEMTSVSLDDTVVVPNLAVLGMVSKLYDASFFTKLGFNMVFKRHGSPALMSTTINDYFWNLTDPLIATAKKLMPHIVPSENMGILHLIYQDFNDEVTVKMGTSNGAEFFQMTEFHGSPRFNFWPEEACDAVAGASEGVTYHQLIARNESLKYFRKTLCRVVHIDYVADIEQNGLVAYRFELPNETFHRPLGSTKDCFTLPGTPVLPDGLTSVAPCYYDFPIAASMPHFLGGERHLVDAVEGLEPCQDKHGSFVIVEPTTGVPMESRARVQSNLVMRPLKGFGDLNRFSNLVVPMFWIEYGQVGLPWYVMTLMYLTAKLVPATQTWTSCLQVITGCFMLLLAARRVTSRGRTRPRYRYSSLDLIPSTDYSDC